MIGWETVLIAQAAFVLGYLCGKTGVVTRNVKEEPAGFFAQNAVKPRSPTVLGNSRQAVEIDERKIVSQINTDTMQKVTQVELGTKTAVADDINASVNRLAQLKGK